jgi:PhnB protein
MATINPYLYFNGNCEEAFTFYKNAFGKEFSFLGRYSDVPQEDKHIFNEEANKIIHVTLPISEETILMGSDNAELFKQQLATNSFSLYVNTSSKEEADHLYNELSKDGNIKVSLSETFWGSYYGLFTDKFGVSWKISFDMGNIK